jgi:hypothetical protein
LWKLINQNRGVLYAAPYHGVKQKRKREEEKDKKKKNK